MQAAESANPSMSAKDGSNNALHSANAPPKKANITASPVSNEATAVSNAKATTSVTAPSTSLGNTSNLTTTGNGVPVTTVSEAATNAETDDEAIRNQKLVEEFQYLLEKSQSLFSGLRDLPPTGSHRQWRPVSINGYFNSKVNVIKVFIYSFSILRKLLKFTQSSGSFNRLIVLSWRIKATMA
ncbi:hypothetical protein BDF20DRAFT_515409 [Mycotypha africana]|uniref:uncharacterized protein n=1 Tax=Mycotypha africana TaxID=64632 RepID=UPI002300E18A|nr:uncharacterized protein BDF20DRAFT_515409 [Mycotypha africana]KAI8979536.1 hypothetical protein BDF20DRAFT_515409 [Mycotypha africana]